MIIYTIVEDNTDSRDGIDLLNCALSQDKAIEIIKEEFSRRIGKYKDRYKIIITNDYSEKDDIEITFTDGKWSKYNYLIQAWEV